MKPEAETPFLAGLRCARYLRARDRPDFAWNFFVPALLHLKRYCAIFCLIVPDNG